MTRFPLRCIFILTLLSGCTVGPDYTPPCIETPDEWKTRSPASVPLPCVDNWWEVFEDETLNRLEMQAVADNPTIMIAMERVLQAKALAGVKRADLFPHASIDPLYSDSEMLVKFQAPALPGIASALSNAIFRLHQFQYNVPINMSYEIDLWGKIRAQYDSALWTVEAQESAYHTALLSLTTDLAGSYYRLRTFDKQIEFYDSIIQTLQQSHTIVEAQFKKGIANNLDLSNASLQLADTQSTREETIRQRGIEEDAIAALIGISASDFVLAPLPLSGEPPVIPPGIPSSILIQRPDIAEAERNMAAEHALVRVAYASFLPSLSLTGALGVSSPDLKNFFRWRSRLWSMGAVSDLTLFDGLKKESDLEASWASFREASADYRQTVLTAFREVEDALNNLEKQQKQIDYLSEAVKAGNLAGRTAAGRYSSGISNYLEVTVNLQLQLNAESSFYAAQGLRYLSTVQLIKALGGRWDTE